QIPKLTPPDGIDTSRRPDQKMQFWLMQHRAAKRQTLLPSTGELRPETVQIRFETIHLDDVVHAFFQPVRTESVNSAVEREIFFITEVGVQVEIVRHVADSLAHPF